MSEEVLLPSSQIYILLTTFHKLSYNDSEHGTVFGNCVWGTAFLLYTPRSNGLLLFLLC
jgi:hypothetical protein